MIRFFGEALQVDIYNYQGGAKIPDEPKDIHLSTWQEALQRSARFL